MDKILLTAFLSSLAGFLTAVLSIVKLVNEKESKTTDYRQNWTDSARTALSDLIGLLNEQAGTLANVTVQKQRLAKMVLDSKSVVADQAKAERLTDFAEHSLKENQAAARSVRREVYKAYAFTRLHFKPNDLSFARIEQSFDVVMGLLRELQDAEDDTKIATLRERIHNATNEMTGHARDILKTEWETVKKGEKAYQRTKDWSIRGSIIMLFILLAIGIHAGIAVWKREGSTSPLIAPSNTQVTKAVHQNEETMSSIQRTETPNTMKPPEITASSSANVIFCDGAATGRGISRNPRSAQNNSEALKVKQEPVALPRC